MSDVGNELKKLGLLSVFNYLEKDPEKNLPEIMNWFDRNVDSSVLTLQRKAFKNVIDDADSVWYNLMLTVWTDIDFGIRKKLFENILINANAEAAPKAQHNREKYGCNIPWAITIELEEEGEHKSAMTFDDWDDVIEQAKELGTFIFVIKGGSTKEREQELIALCNKHEECEFFFVTQGDEVDSDLADEVLRVQNLVIALQIEADESPEKIAEITGIMREKKLAYVAIAEYDKETQDHFATSEFYDILAENRVKVALLMSDLSDEEDTLYPKMVKYRSEKPVFAINFCKDRWITNGCMAGGRYHCHINAFGDVEPCFFLHKSDTNLKEHKLIDAFKAPLFMEFKGEIGSCPITDKAMAEKLRNRADKQK